MKTPGQRRRSTRPRRLRRHARRHRPALPGAARLLSPAGRGGLRRRRRARHAVQPGRPRDAGAVRPRPAPHGAGLRRDVPRACAAAGVPARGPDRRARCAELGRELLRSAARVRGGAGRAAPPERRASTVIYTQSGDLEYQLDCIRGAGIVDIVTEANVHVCAARTWNVPPDAQAYGVATRRGVDDRQQHAQRHQSRAGGGRQRHPRRDARPVGVRPGGAGVAALPPRRASAPTSSPPTSRPPRRTTGSSRTSWGMPGSRRWRTSSPTCRRTTTSPAARHRTSSAGVSARTRSSASSPAADDGHGRRTRNVHVRAGRSARARAAARHRRAGHPARGADVPATRSGGPGGQHVNTSSTRVELSSTSARRRR
jgi:hypothetical protein